MMRHCIEYAQPVRLPAEMLLNQNVKICQHKRQGNDKKHNAAYCFKNDSFHAVTPLTAGESVQIHATRWNFGAPSNVQAIKLRPVCA